MSSYILIVPILVGVTIAVQTAIVSAATDSISPLALSLALMFGGVLVGSLWASARGDWNVVGAVLLHWWWLPLGVAGWVIVAVLGWSANLLGVANALALVVGAQLVTGLVLDRALGAGQMSVSSLVGIMLVVAGVLLMRPA